MSALGGKRTLGPPLGPPGFAVQPLSAEHANTGNHQQGSSNVGPCAYSKPPWVIGFIDARAFTSS